ncbi:MAG: hypothetical protein ACI9FB_002878 [Candidatus Azotimanducaceae bacterium]|jgi:hypothetical protein
MKDNDNFSCEQNRNLLMDFVDNTLNPLQKQSVEMHLGRCEDCTSNLQDCWEMQALSTSWQDEKVPHWARRKTFFEGYQWLPKLQMASTFATMFVLVLVLGSAQISTTNGLQISFGQKDFLTNSDLEQKITSLQDQLYDQQSIQLQRNVADLSSRQVATNQLLLKTILERSREERREDIDTLATNWYLSQNQQTEQTNDSLRALLINQVEDRRNINQINQLLSNASLEGNSL